MAESTSNSSNQIMPEVAEKPRFWNYPSPKEGPEIPYQNNAAPNPVLRGYLLALAVRM
jgi:hypothetical protein